MAMGNTQSLAQKRPLTTLPTPAQEGQTGQEREAIQEASARFTSAPANMDTPPAWLENALKAQKDVAEFRTTKKSAPTTKAEQPAAQEKKSRKLIPTPISVIKAREFPTDCIEGLLPQTGLAVLGGASGDGKSFLALDMGAHIAFKLDWFGRKVEAARPVYYFYLENPDGIKQRVIAWEKQNPGHEIVDNCGYEFFEVTLDMAHDVEELAEILPPNAVLIIDTLRKANPGKNENTPEGMGEILAQMQKLVALRRDILIVVVHHVPKTTTQAADSRNKLAGHYSLPADTDAVLLTERKDDVRTLWVGKSREDEDGLGFAFKLNKHEVGKRPNNTDVYSLAVEWTGKPEVKKRIRKMGEAEKDARRALIMAQDMAKSNTVLYSNWQQFFIDICHDERPELFQEKDGTAKDKNTANENVRKRFERARDILKSNNNRTIKIKNGQYVEILKTIEI